MVQVKHLFRRLVIGAFLIIAWPSHPAPNAESPQNDPEIARLKKETAQVRTERQRVREDISRDKNEFSAYQERIASRKHDYTAETDSIRRLTASYERKKDSLDAFISSIESKKRNFELMKDRVREHIALACEKLLSAIKKIPPAVSRPAVGALTFLLNDCATKNIDNIEAMQRFVQIARNLDEASYSIQTGQEASAVPQLRGNASMLRIGTVFEALVDEDDKTAAVWQGGEAGLPEWRVLSEGEYAGMISKAIAIRESKSMPAFIVLPWRTERPKETGK
jgi:hypothetical protein